MTINEAVQLVLQASTMAEGGDVFLLDMGEPVSILKLAKQMIRLSGFTIKNNKNPNGDIEIINIGLRSGEKLFEELLINADAQLTKHPLIFKANESYIKKKELWKYLDEMNELINLEIDENLRAIKLEKILSKLVPEWRGSIKISQDQ